MVTLNAANTYTGQTILNTATSGVVRLGVDNALPVGTALVFGSTQAAGAVDLNGHTQTVASLTNAFTGSDGIANTSGATAAANLVINGSAVTSFNSSIGIPAVVTNLTGANNNIALTLASGNTGTLALSGANGYAGGTTILGGTLRADTATAAASATGTGAVTVGDGINASSGTLAGGTTAAPGRVAGTVTVNRGGTLTAGTGGTPTDTIGTLSTGTETWSGGTYAVKLNAATAGAGVAGSSDELLLSNLSGGSTTLTVNPITTGGTLTAPASFVIADDAGSATGFNLANLSVNQTSSAGTFSLSTASDNAGGEELLLSLTAAPEPTSLLLTATAAAPLVLARRRRQPTA